MLNIPTLKKTLLVGFVVCVLAAACSSNDGTTLDVPETSTTVGVAEPPVTTEPLPDPTTAVVDDTTTTSDDIDDTTTTVEPDIAEPLEPIHGVVPLPPEIQELLVPEPVVITAPPTTAASTTIPEPVTPETTESSTDSSSTTTPQTTAPATTVPSGPVSEPITDSGVMWQPDGYGRHPDAAPPRALPASDPVYLVPGMALTYTKEIDRLQPLLNGAVITKIFFYENPQQTSAHICVDGIPKEWSLRLARTDTPDYYRIVFSTVTILTTGEMYHRPQVGDPPDGEPC